MPEFQRLLEVASSPHLGFTVADDKLLPVARDPLSAALDATWPHWRADRLVDHAATEAEREDDISLVGLAARTRDPVLLAAVRESVVLYAEVLAIGLPTQDEYVWQVSPELAELGKRFVSAVAVVLNATLPEPEAASAEIFWRAAQRNRVEGRCVRLGVARENRKQLHYHWAIKRAHQGLQLHEFWDAQVWTTAMYRQVHA